MSFFDILANDVSVNLGENDTRKEPTTVFQLENEQYVREEPRPLVGRDQHTLQSSVERTNHGSTIDETASTGIYEQSEPENESSEGNNARMDSSSQFDEKSTLSRVRLKSEDVNDIKSAYTKMMKQGSLLSCFNSHIKATIL